MVVPQEKVWPFSLLSPGRDSGLPTELWEDRALSTGGSLPVTAPLHKGQESRSLRKARTKGASLGSVVDV